MSEQEQEKQGRGRPRLKLDKQQIQRLAELQCTRQEIAYVMGCSLDTLARHHRPDIDMGNAMGKIKLRRAMMRNATEKDNATIQIWLSKQWLGYTDAPVSDEDNLILPWETDSETTNTPENQD